MTPTAKMSDYHESEFDRRQREHSEQVRKLGGSILGGLALAVGFYGVLHVVAVVENAAAYEEIARTPDKPTVQHDRLCNNIERRT